MPARELEFALETALLCQPEQSVSIKLALLYDYQTLTSAALRVLLLRCFLLLSRSSLRLRCWPHRAKFRFSVRPWQSRQTSSYGEVQTRCPPDRLSPRMLLFLALPVSGIMEFLGQRCCARRRGFARQGVDVAFFSLWRTPRALL